MTENIKDLFEEKRGDAMDKALTEEISYDFLVSILDKTIKFDVSTKMILFLTMLGVFTEDEQSNVFVTGSSSIGKTWSIQQIAWFFKASRLFEYSNASPKSFFYANDAQQCIKEGDEFTPIDFSKKPKEGSSQEEFQIWYEIMRKSVYYRDLESTIHIFYDQKNTLIQEELRSLLSRDQPSRIYWFPSVNRSKSGRIQNYDVYIRGNITSIFATAFENMNEQEKTRNFLLSPEWTPAKEKAVKDLSDKFDSDPNFKKTLEEDFDRLFLRSRILLVQTEGISKVYIPIELVDKIRKWFDTKELRHQPKTSRDYPRAKQIAKYWALLNFKNRRQETINDKKIIWCDETDIDTAIKIYSNIFRCAELGMSPEVYDMWEKVVIPNLNDNGLTIAKTHEYYAVQYGYGISDDRLRGIMKGYAKLGLCMETKDGKLLIYLPIQQIKKKESPALDSFGNHPLPEPTKEGDN
jgi:hypothetical protein